MPTIKDEIARLKRDGTPNEHVCVIVWSIGDVLERAYEKRVKISKLEAEEILDQMSHNHDASIGITWDTIDIYIGDLIEKRTEEENKTEKVQFS